MEERKCVVVYGSSLNMAGIAVSLSANASLDVVHLNPNSPTARARLSEINPTAVAFDMSRPTPGIDFTLLRECPELLLIGVDPSLDELLVLSCQTARAQSLADLVEVIYQKSLRQKSSSRTYTQEKRNEK